MVTKKGNAILLALGGPPHGSADQGEEEEAPSEELIALSEEMMQAKTPEDYARALQAAIRCCQME